MPVCNTRLRRVGSVSGSALSPRRASTEAEMSQNGTIKNDGEIGTPSKTAYVLFLLTRITYILSNLFTIATKNHPFKRSIL